MKKKYQSPQSEEIVVRPQESLLQILETSQTEVPSGEGEGDD